MDVSLCKIWKSQSWLIPLSIVEQAQDALDVLGSSPHCQHCLAECCSVPGWGWKVTSSLPPSILALGVVHFRRHSQSSTLQEPSLEADRECSTQMHCRNSEEGSKNKRKGLETYSMYNCMSHCNYVSAWCDAMCVCDYVPGSVKLLSPILCELSLKAFSLPAVSPA